MHLTAREYRRRYAAPAWEWEWVNCDGFKPGTHTALLHEIRSLWLLERLENLLAVKPSAKDQPVPVLLDVGCFPGTLGRIIRDIYGRRLTLIGAGLCLNDAFRAATTTVYDSLQEVELDPLHSQAKAGVANQFRLADQSVDVVVAGEIFEHFYSPLHFIQEIARVLKPGGHLLMTTPNVCYIGNTFRLLSGKSCYETLATSHLFKIDEWRPHMRVYAAAELVELMQAAQMTPREIRRLQSHEERYYTFRWRRWGNLCVINALAFLVPHWRNQLCLDFQKSGVT